MQHGRRLTRREYENEIVSLHSSRAPAPDKAEDERIHRQELDLTIDFRLGKSFPRDRREAMWRIQQRIEKKRVQLATRWLAGLLVPSWLHRRAEGVAKFVIDEYAQVLSREELEAYFGADEVEHPSLPRDLP